MAYPVIGKVKVGPAGVFFGSLCVQTHKEGEKRASSLPFLSLSLFFVPFLLLLLLYLWF